MRRRRGAETNISPEDRRIRKLSEKYGVGYGLIVRLCCPNCRAVKSVIDSYGRVHPAFTHRNTLIYMFRASREAFSQQSVDAEDEVLYIVGCGAQYWEKRRQRDPGYTGEGATVCAIVADLTPESFTLYYNPKDMSMKTLFAISTALVVSFVAIIACGANDNQPAGQAAVYAAETTSGGKIHNLSSVGPKAAKDMMTDFSWKEGDKTMSLSKLGEGKIIFLNFWATWCPPCRKEIPDIVSISNEMKNVVVVGVALERGATDKLSSFIDQNKIPYVNIVGTDDLLGKLTQAYGGIQYVPTTFIISNGKIIATLVGGKSKAEFTEAIKKAM